MTLLLAAFRGKFFRHLGYVLDLAVVSVCLYHEMAGMGKGETHRTDWSTHFIVQAAFTKKWPEWERMTYIGQIGRIR